LNQKLDLKKRDQFFSDENEEDEQAEEVQKPLFPVPAISTTFRGKREFNRKVGIIKRYLQVKRQKSVIIYILKDAHVTHGKAEVENKNEDKGQKESTVKSEAEIRRDRKRKTIIRNKGLKM